jgi:hypothetical protein
LPCVGRSFAIAFRLWLIARCSYHQQDIDAELYVEAEAAIILFDRLMQAAQGRRLVLLRELQIGD